MSNGGTPAGAEEHVWIWDLYPLSPRQWGNRQHPARRVPLGQELTVTVQYSPVYNDWLRTTYQPRPDHRRFYRPTPVDLAIVKRAFPDADPENPSWPNIEARLIVAGRAKAELVELNAPTLIQLLADIAAGAGRDNAGSDTPGAAGDGPLSPRQAEAWGQYELVRKLLIAPGQPEPSDRAVYERAQQLERAEGRSELPYSFATWGRYVREARKRLGKPRNTPRSGRDGRSTPSIDKV